MDQPPFRSCGPRRLAPLALLCMGFTVACDRAAETPDANDDAATVDSWREDGGSAPLDAREEAGRADAASIDGEAGSVDGATSDDGGRASDAGPLPCMPLVEPSGAAALGARHHDGQTFVQWSDRAQADAGAAFRYNVYRSREPITDGSLARAQLISRGVLNHSGQLFGAAFNAAERLSATRPMSPTYEGGPALPLWSGLAVHTAVRDECAYYAVIATDPMGTAVEAVQPGFNAMIAPIAERVGARAPIKLYDSTMRGPDSASTRITGVPNRPLDLILHASNAQGGGAGAYGDYYLYFADETMGWVDGMPGVFSVEETHTATPTLWIRNRDTVINPSGVGGFETYWFGYATVPQWAPTRAPRAYAFTERRLDWIVRWAIDRYRADANHVTCGGGSMGAWGTTAYCFHRPAVFAAVYADRPRTRQLALPSLAISPAASAASTLMEDDATPYLTRMDSVRYAASASGELPFYAFGIGRRDGFATWQEQIDMVRALTQAKRGFAFAWNNGDHSVGSAAIDRVRRDYPPARFALNESYPAFGNSSLDDDLGDGDPANGALEGGINLGFVWSVTLDDARQWTLALSNSRATREITVDVTPRRAQRFRLPAGTSVRWTSSTGDNGTITTDAAGLATVPRVRIPNGQRITLALDAR